METDIYEQVTRDISIHRSARNLNTLWNRDHLLLKFLRKGLQLRQRREVCGESDQPFVDVQIADWKRALMTKIPPSWRLNGTFMRFAAAESITIGSKILENCDFVDTRSRLTLFAFGVRCISYPGQITSTFIVLVATTKVSEGEKRRMTFEKQRRERLHQQKDKESDGLAPMLDRLESLRRSSSLRSVEGSPHERSVSPHEVTETLDMERDEDEDVDWEAIYKDIRSEAPQEFDRLVEYYIEEGYDEDSAKYWASYYTKKLLGEEEDIEDA
eukprot:Blabericola_migrator_1__4040@NODE_2229_length_3093_cov_78_641441_g376_i2_p2_GENE_NODE_2229_length_3093_cov_78_641441_g376_i2NODE_2229_length_3093_cov_78_641441_g376_i2_p2_ORF_typecomplete_len271_score64_52_NODE_2229_length_3093_cov_78_641441_g376_i272884